MRPKRLLLCMGALLAALVAAGVLLLASGSASAFMIGRAGHSAYLHRASTSSTSRASQPAPGVHQVIVDGHCQLVDDQGVPLEDPLFWQRTGHDPC
jgi:Flp pilus assembly protein CpaB